MKGIRKSKIRGTQTLPRLSVFRSMQNIYAQIIDDTSGKTLVAASSLGLKGYSGNSKAAKEVGKALAEKAKILKIAKVVFDRGGRAYHGRVSALAEGAREGGLIF
jgi:large subunit ribosomal protein L18